MKKTKVNWSLSTKWTLAYSAMILLVTGTMAFGLYLQLRIAQRQVLRERLRDIVNFAAPLVDGDFHSLIRSPEDENGSFYHVVSLRLQSIQETSNVIQRIYTLRQGEDGRITYVVDVDPDNPASVGQEYTRSSPLLEGGLASISQATVEDKLYTDPSGTYLSGYAPIYDQFRDLDGVLGIDIDATAIIANEVRARRIAGLAFLATVPLTFLLGWWLARYLTAPMKDLMDGVERITQGQLDEGVPVHGQDELGVLAKAFNYMTTQLRQTLGGLEQEIAEHKRAEKIQDAVYRISQAVSSTDSIDELYQSIYAILGELIAVDNFYISLYDPDTDLLSFPFYLDQYDEHPSPVKPKSGLTGYILRTGRPLLVTPEVFTELVQNGEVELIGTKPVDWMGAPLKVENEIIGVMAVQSYSEEIRFNQENLALFEFVSIQVALAIERKRVLEGLHSSNERYHALFNDSPISLWEEDFSGVKDILDSLHRKGVRDFRSYLDDHPEIVAECARQVQVLDINKATLELFGAKSKEDMLVNLSSLFTEESYEDFKDELVYIGEGRTEFYWEGVNQTLDGKRIEVRIGWSVVPGYESDLSKVIIYILDITKEQENKRNLQRRLGELTTLHAITLAGLEAEDEDTLIEKATYLIGESLFSEYFNILTVDDKRERLVMHTTYHTVEERKDVEIPLGEGISGRAAQRGETCYIPDVTINLLRPLCSISTISRRSTIPKAISSVMKPCGQ
ncbi:MAG: Sensor histidine kinase ResE [Chloroflexi bacterium]|nr:Sensor histidine kinase ResE [Chloroflexota bacterium]